MIKQITKHLGVYPQARKLFTIWRHVRHFLVRGCFRRFIIARYLRRGTKRLHIACGERNIPGWLNADLYAGDIYLNALRQLPFPDDSFDAIYSHHFIEHITPDQLGGLLRECRRILKPGGRIRLVTPDLQALISIYQLYRDASYFSRLMFNDGEHLCVYDRVSLKIALRKTGFSDPSEYPYGSSPNWIFDGVDDHGYAGIEEYSLCMEAVYK